MVWFSRSDEKKKHDQDKYACKIILIFLDYFNKVYRILTLFTLTSGFMTGSLYYNIGMPFGSTSIICQKNGKFANSKIFIAKSSFMKQKLCKKNPDLANSNLQKHFQNF